MTLTRRKLLTKNYKNKPKKSLVTVLTHQQQYIILQSSVSWLSRSAFVFGAGSLRCKSRASQIEHSVANGSAPLQHFLKKTCVSRRSNDTWMGTSSLISPTR